MDGAGRPNGGYGYFVKETGDSYYEKSPDLTNTQAEYLAIISALKMLVGSLCSISDDNSNNRPDAVTPDSSIDPPLLKKHNTYKQTDKITIFSDSLTTVKQLNHEYAIKGEELRTQAQQAWHLMASFENLSIVWVRRHENLAGKMLGS